MTAPEDMERLRYALCARRCREAAKRGRSCAREQGMRDCSWVAWCDAVVREADEVTREAR